MHTLYISTCNLSNKPSDFGGSRITTGVTGAGLDILFASEVMACFTVNLVFRKSDPSADATAGSKDSGSETLP